jgi:hypothetical protein
VVVRLVFGLVWSLVRGLLVRTEFVNTEERILLEFFFDLVIKLFGNRFEEVIRVINEALSELGHWG